MKKIYLAILGLIGSIVLNAQVTVTAPSATTVGCTVGSVSAFAPLGNITIQETAINDISGTGTFILTAPGNFRFQAGVGIVNASAGDLTISGVTVTATTITFTITVNSTTNLDVITISGVQIRDLSTPSGPLNILRTTGAAGGTAVVSGDAGGGGVNHGTLTSQVWVTAPVATAATGITCTTANINWNTVLTATSYRYDVSTDAGFVTLVRTNVLVTVPTTTANLTALTIGTTYWFRVRAIGPCSTTANSNVISFTTLIAPSIPVANAGTGATCTQITANWQASANSTTYLLDVSTDIAFGSFVGIYNNLDVGNITTLNITGLTPGTTYYYRVRGSNNCGTSGNSGTITYATLAGPAAPAATAGTAAACTTITANWGAVASATGYFLDVSTDPAFGSFVTGYNNLSVGNVLTSNVTGLTAGTTYYYRVRATNACGTGVSSNVITYATLDVPAAPVAIAGTGATCNQITANWNASAGATGYFLDVSTDPAFGTFVGIYNNLNVGNVLTSNVTGLTLGTTYYYRIRATNACGTGVSSNVITYATLDVPAPPVATAGSGATCTQITANWNASANATGYRLDVSTDPGFIAGSFVGVYNNFDVGNVLTRNVAFLTSGVTYYYRVRAYNTCGTSASSNAITYATLTAPAIPVADPATGILCTSADANWQVSANATSYRLDVSLDPAFGSFVVGYNNRNVANVITYPVTGLAGGTTYYYRIRANNACATSANSNVISFITSTAIPATPGPITQPVNTCASSTGNTFSITAVSGATSYTWSVTGTGWAVTAGGTTISATITIGTGVGTVSVTATNACGTSAPSTTGNITPTTIPATPGVITQPTDKCASSTANTFSITPVGGATSYTWSVTGTGWAVTAGGTTASATITIGTAVGTVSVTATNACGTSAASTTGNITPTTIPATPGAITQPANACASSTGNTFSITPVAGATSYTWSVTGTGWAVTAGGTTASATITIGTAVGTVSVTATNACGTSAATTTGNITPTTIPPTPGIITQPANTCASSIGKYFQHYPAAERYFLYMDCNRNRMGSNSRRNNHFSYDNYRHRSRDCICYRNKMPAAPVLHLPQGI